MGDLLYFGLINGWIVQHCKNSYISAATVLFNEDYFGVLGKLMAGSGKNSLII